MLPRSLRYPFAAAFALLLIALPLSAQTPYPSGEPLVSELRLENWTNTNQGQSRVTKVAVTVPGATEGYELETTADLSNPWEAQLMRGIPKAVTTGDVGFIRFYARMTKTRQESGGAFLSVYVQGGAPNWEKSLSQELWITDQWQEYTLPFAYIQAYSANGSSIVLATGYRGQTIQIAGFDAVYYGKTVVLGTLPRTRQTYPGREANAAWRTAANARIEQYRKGDFAIQVVDANDQPVSGAQVSVTMKRHAFEFGSALVMSRLVQDDADSRMYRRKVLELFNAASPENDLKAQPWQGEWGAGYGREQTLRGLQWLNDHGIPTRGHVLVWPSWRNSPKSVTDLQNTRPNDIPQRILTHIADIVPATRDLLYEWDVENEPYDNHDLMDLFGNQIQADWFKAARQHHPTARLVLNDYANDDLARHAAKIAHFISNTNYVRSLGAPVTGIGLQAHMGANPTPPANFVATLDHYAANIGLPVRITEFDINSDDEDLQADYTRDFYTAAFSHPSVLGVQMWGFWERQHWITKAAMIRADWTEKPAAAAYRELLYSTWWTNVTGAADADGAYRGRGFHGDYEVVVKHNGQTVRRTMRLEPGAGTTTTKVHLVPPRLVNVSTRASARSGIETLIGGFTVAGAPTKPMLVRGVGPYLGEFGLPYLAKPQLKLYRGSALVGTYNAWETNGQTEALRQATASIGTFPLKDGAADAAILPALEEGSYTVHVVGADGGQGISLFEAYEASNTGRLTNLSTRAYAGRDADVAIVGFVVGGPTAQRLLIRAIGPGLVPHGVTGALSRPSLKLYRGSEVIATNVGWQSTGQAAELAAATAATGAFALRESDGDSAMVVTVEPGNYTAIAQGFDGATGVCLLELYVVPE